MKINVKREVLVDIKYLCLDIQPRYWEDSEINGEDDISWEEQKEGKAPRMPLSYDNGEGGEDGYSLKMKIDFETGIIEGWPEGIEANLHYKVCDQGTYWLESAEGEEIHKINSYVPDILDFHDGYGDYLIMTIEKGGHIKEWNFEEEACLIDNFLEEEGF